MVQAAGKHGVLHWVCNNAGRTKEDMAAARSPSQTLFWQVYVKADLEKSEEEIKEAVKLGYKGFALTVDAIRPGKRERDIRASFAEASENDTDEEEGDEAFSQAPTVKRP